MKNLLFVVGVISFVLFGCEKTEESDGNSISMGQGYANDIYYKLGTGVVKAVDRLNWDIAFSTNPRTSSILINEGAGIKLYVYPSAIDGYDTITGAATDNMVPLYNADSTWYFSAFERNALGHPDYGWGVYNGLNHNVIGDSVFVIALSDTSVKKIKIIDRDATSNTFHFNYGDIDAVTSATSTMTAESVAEDYAVGCADYLTKNFVYYSLTNKEILNREPDADNWDLLFTQYHDEAIDYIVTGVLVNDGVQVIEVRDKAISEADTTDGEWSDNISTIGWDWKTYDNGINLYTMVENLCYFVKTQAGNVYKLYFIDAEGSATGTMKFRVEKVK